MIELPSWATTVLEVFSYAVFGLPLVLYAVFGAGVIIAAFAYPIWFAIRGHDADGPAPFIVRVVVGLLGGLMLLSLVAPWL